MAEEQKKIGRPAISEEDKQLYLSKLEPYLKSGLRITKALIEAGIPSANYYRIMEEDEMFREKINAYKQYLSVMLNSAMYAQLQDIVKKKMENKPLTKEEVEFLKWYALNNNNAKEEFGERKDISLFDPEVEIQRVKKMIDDNSTEEIEGFTDK